ncbi:ROK family transcriptional regulator [Psychromarinibacter sp. S121]|uniref:ROK family transcriptional regulator n=1 Tax=Psychromarinibacter sp. S121 TaxID=3415127 RepID=UPI003C7DF0DB
MPRRKQSGEEIAHYNQFVVLEIIRKMAPLSRADIVRETGLAVQTVSNIADALIRSDLLLEERRKVNGRGQPPIDLRLNPGGRYAVGVALDGRKLIAVLCDFIGDEVACIERDVGSMNPDEVLPAIARATETLIRDSGVSRDLLLGLGLVMPGLSSHGKFSRLVRGHPWRDMWLHRAFVEELSEMVGMPVLTDNDRTAAALSERLSGRGQEAENFLYVYFGSGIGGGLVFGGIPYRGRDGRAGEIGHMVVDPGGRECSCGNKGCLERYASLQSLQCLLSGRRFDAEPTDTVRLARAVAEAHPTALEWLDEAAEHLKTAIVTLENILNFDTVFLGGVIPDAVLEALMERLEPLPPSMSSGREDALPRLCRAGIGRNAAARGAAALVVLDSTVPDFSRFQGGLLPARGRSRGQKAVKAAE